MKKITGPIDGLTVIWRALEFANTREITDAVASCQRARVLPPGAPYVIDECGNVFAVPLGNRDSLPVVKECHGVINTALAHIIRGVVPHVAKSWHLARKEIVRTRHKDGDTTDELVSTTLLDWSLPTPRWFRVQGFQRRKTAKREYAFAGDDAELIVPTLDGLVAAAALVMYENRDHVKRCPYCRKYFVRGRRKQSTCRSSRCENERVRTINNSAARRSRAKKKSQVMSAR